MNTNKLYSLFLSICFLLVSCSSDDDGGGGSITDKDLAGKWYATEVGWIVDASDPKAKEILDNDWWDTIFDFPTGGYLDFKPDRGIYGDAPEFVEGIMGRSCSYLNPSSYERGEYYCKGDTIFYFNHNYDSNLSWEDWQSGKWKRYHIKKGSKIYYTRDNTANCNYLYPNLGIRSAVYRVVYTKKK